MSSRSRPALYVAQTPSPVQAAPRPTRAWHEIPESPLVSFRARSAAAAAALVGNPQNQHPHNRHGATVPPSSTATPQPQSVMVGETPVKAIDEAVGGGRRRRSSISTPNGHLSTPAMVNEERERAFWSAQAARWRVTPPPQHSSVRVVCAPPPPSIPLLAEVKENRPPSTNALPTKHPHYEHESSNRLSLSSIGGAMRRRSSYGGGVPSRQHPLATLAASPTRHGGVVAAAAAATGASEGRRPRHCGGAPPTQSHAPPPPPPQPRAELLVHAQRGVCRRRRCRSPLTGANVTATGGRGRGAEGGGDEQVEEEEASQELPIDLSASARPLRRKRRRRRRRGCLVLAGGTSPHETQTQTQTQTPAAAHAARRAR